MSIPPVVVTWTASPDGTVGASWTAETPFDEYTVVLDGAVLTVQGTSVGPLPGNVPHTITVTPSAADATSASASFTPVVSGSRSALVQAYTSTSIWNQPIGSAAVRVAAGLHKRTGSSQVADQRVIFMDPAQPLTDLSGTKVPMDPKFTWVPGATQGSGNSGYAAVLADGVSDVQGGKFTRPTAGGAATANRVVGVANELMSDGLTGECGGTALSTLGGVIRVGEFTKGLIPHAVAINLFGHTDCDPAGGGFMWPATKADSYAETGSGNPAYAGTNPAVKMGTLLALPATFDTSTLLSKPGKILAQAAIDYGFYPVNDTARSVFALVVEAGPAGLVTAEFQKLFAMPLDTGLSDTAWAKDVDTIFAFLEAITNNAPGSIGGGGTPLVALAPPLAGQGPPPPPQIPAPPVGFTASAVAGPAVSLGWAAESTATDFPLTKDGMSFGDPITDAVTDTAVKAGETHVYTVAAHNSAGTSATVSQSITIPTAPPPPPPTRLIDLLVVISFENQPLSNFTTANAPYLTSLVKSGAQATNMVNLAHPSEPNYVAAWGGNTFGLTADTPGFVVSAANLTDSLETAGLTWNFYAESMTSPLTDNGQYVQKHMAPIHFTDVRTNSARMAHIKPFTAWNPAAITENFIWLVPNILDCGHTPGGAAGMTNFDNWCKTHIPPILAAMAGKRALLHIWCDESEGSTNLLPSIFLGPAAKPGVVSKTLYSPGKYCELATWEHLLGLPTLTANDAKATIMADMLA